MTDDDELRPRHRHITIAMPLTAHDIVPFVYDDWDDVWHTNRTVGAISPTSPDTIESL